MHEHVVEATAALLQSDALQNEITHYIADFSQGFTVTAKDVNGLTYPLIINRPIAIDTFANVLIGEPPVDPPAPFPCAYVYHIMSDYPPEQQEDNIIQGHHRVSITLIGTGATSQDAERYAGRMGSIIKKLLERNQYIYGQLPRAMGSSSLTFVESEVTGQHVASTRVPYHVIFVARVRELRY